MRLFALALAGVALTSCKTVRTGDARASYSLSSVSVSIPGKDAFPAGSPYEKIDSVRVKVDTGASLSKAECRLVNGKDEIAAAKDGKGTVGVKLPQTCSYLITASLNIGEDSVYTGGMPLGPNDLMGKDNLKIVMGMVPTPKGVELGFATKTNLEVSTAKETNIEVETVINTSRFDVTKYIEIGQIQPIQKNEVIFYVTTATISKIAPKLKGLAVRCSFGYEVDFTTQDIPPLTFKEVVDDGRYVDIPADVETAEMRLVWQISTEKMKRIQAPNQSSAKVTRFACLTNKDPALQP